MVTKSIEVGAGFCLFLALLLLVLPLRWLLAAAFAAAVHEACHLSAIRLLSGRSASIQLHASGAKIGLPYMSRGREAVCAMAGPLGSLGLLLLARWMPRVALCAVAQSAVNLLPIYPLDGGRVLQSLFSIFCTPPVADRFCKYIAGGCRILLFLLSFYATFTLQLGLLPVFLVMLLLMRTK